MLELSNNSLLMGKTSFFNTGITEEKFAYEKTFFVNTWIIEEHSAYKQDILYLFFYTWMIEEWLKNCCKFQSQLKNSLP